MGMLHSILFLVSFHFPVVLCNVLSRAYIPVQRTIDESALTSDESWYRLSHGKEPPGKDPRFRHAGYP